MKTLLRVVAVAILATMVLSLVACSSFGEIKESFEKNEYVYVENADFEKTAEAIIAGLEKDNISCTAHLFKTDGLFGIDVYALVLEFASEDDLAVALSESTALKVFFEDSQDSEYVNGNCLLVPISLTKADEMLKIFNGEKLD